MIRLNSCRYMLSCGLTLAIFGLPDSGHAASFRVVYEFGVESDGAVPFLMPGSSRTRLAIFTV
jgi:hypothetical protein